MSHFYVRKLENPTPSELERILDLYEAAKWWVPTRPEDIQTLRQMLTNSYGFWVMESAESGIVGMARVLGDGISDVYIQDVTILPEFRHQKLATELVDEITQNLTQAGIDFIGLIAEQNTKDLYTSCGFEPMPNACPMRYQRKIHETR